MAVRSIVQRFAGVALLGASCVSAMPAQAQHASETGFYTPTWGMCCNFTFDGTRLQQVPFAAATSFTGPPAGVTATAASNVYVKRAAASFTSLSSDTSGVTDAEFSGLTGYFDQTFVQGQNLPPTVRASASETTILYPAGTSLARFGVFFDRSLSVDLVPNTAAITDYVRGFVAANGITDPNAVIGIDVASIYADASMQVRFSDRVDPRNQLLYEISSGLQSKVSIETSIARIALADFDLYTDEKSFLVTQLVVNDVGFNSSSYIVDELPYASPFSVSNSYIVSQPLFLRGDRTYQFDMGVTCRLDLLGASRFFTGSSAACDADRSGYWNGLVSATGEFGKPIDIPDLLGENGFNYRFASPLSPDPPVIPVEPNAVVPEPASWALLIAGAGILGTMRRRRQADFQPS
jgi:hypothetical protein